MLANFVYRGFDTLNKFDKPSFDGYSLSCIFQKIHVKDGDISSFCDLKTDSKNRLFVLFVGFDQCKLHFYPKYSLNIIKLAN